MADLQWAPGSAGSVPDGAVEVDGAYVGRAHHDQGVIVGPVVCAESCCMIGYCGEQFNKDEYEVLLEPTDGRRLRWEPCDGSNMPEGAVEAGYLCSGHKLYVTRAKKDDKFIIGHMNTTHCVCCIPYQGASCDCTDFQVLVAYSV
ncbi:uncharacterized protein LOC122386733 [Amphibalanus amphitrite]|uniref:uncharacterized protein LOC122386733 n=1 Tax=Amphibalanus amphitrite TaxID=1232801 RepID=UPI001C913032|nr:uncharacterized protein LOC122386733 [Amphibalanus amphitrite]